MRWRRDEAECHSSSSDEADGDGSVRAALLLAGGAVTLPDDERSIALMVPIALEVSSLFATTGISSVVVLVLVLAAD